MKKIVIILVITLFAKSYSLAATQRQSWWQHLSNSIAQYSCSDIKSAILVATNRVIKGAYAIELPSCRRTKKPIANTRRANAVTCHRQTGHRKAQCTLLILALGQLVIGMSPMDVLLVTCLVGGVMAQPIEEMPSLPFFTYEQAPPEDKSLEAWLRIDHREDGTAGSGFATKLPSGKTIIITNHHVVSARDGLTISKSPYVSSCRWASKTQLACKSFSTKIIATDPTTDLAALEVTQEQAQLLNPLIIADIDASNGEKIYCIGAAHADPLHNPTLRFGSLTQAVPTVLYEKGEYPLSIILTNAISAPGSSGSACINQNGEVIGVTQGIFNLIDSLQKICIKPESAIIPASILNKFLSQVEQQTSEEICWPKDVFYLKNEIAMINHIGTDIKNLAKSLIDSQKKIFLPSYQKTIRLNTISRINAALILLGELSQYYPTLQCVALFILPSELENFWE